MAPRPAGAGGIASGGLRTAIYRVPDLDAAVRWYTEAFGAGPYHNDGHYAGFDIAGYELGLMRSPGAGAPAAAGVAAYWDVEDVAEAARRLVALGAAAVEPPTGVGGGIVVGSVADPWGNVIGLIRNPGFTHR